MDWEDPPEEGMATHSSILDWRIPWTEESGRLQSIGSFHRAGHSQSNLACSHIPLDMALLCTTLHGDVWVSLVSENLSSGDKDNDTLAGSWALRRELSLLSEQAGKSSR